MYVSAILGGKTFINEPLGRLRDDIPKEERDCKQERATRIIRT